MANWNFRYNSLDWTKSNHELSIEMSVSTKAIARARKRRGIQKVKLWDGAGNPSPNNQDVLWQSSPVTKPINDLDHIFASSKRKDGRDKPNRSFRNAVKRVYGNACQVCKYHQPLVSNHVHHIVPLSQGGLNTIRNAIVLCSRCHDEVHAGFIKLEDSCQKKT